MSSPACLALYELQAGEWLAGFAVGKQTVAGFEELRYDSIIKTSRF
jgi:hypothetical protein